LSEQWGSGDSGESSHARAPCPPMAYGFAVLGRDVWRRLQNTLMIRICVKSPALLHENGVQSEYADCALVGQCVLHADPVAAAHIVVAVSRVDAPGQLDGHRCVIGRQIARLYRWAEGVEVAVLCDGFRTLRLALPQPPSCCPGAAAPQARSTSCTTSSVRSAKAFCVSARLPESTRICASKSA